MDTTTTATNNTLHAAATGPFALNRLPTPVLVRIIAYSDPLQWHALGNASVRTIINLTSFRCRWICSLTCNSNVRLCPAAVDDILHTTAVVLDPISKLVGSDSWISENFIRAFISHSPRLFDALAPCLNLKLLLCERPNVDLASMIVRHSSLDMCMLNGQYIRAILESRPNVWMLQWLENNGLNIQSAYQQESCFNMAILSSWTMDSRVDLLGFLARRNISLPARSLLEYALSHSTPATVGFLVDHSSASQDRISWNDLLMMACTDAMTRLDVFQFIVANTEPTIVWTFAACCLATHAMMDDSAYMKFSALRNSPNAVQWLTRSMRGRTPIQCLCERLTYENMPYISPFIRDYLDLGVSAAGMPSIVAMLCQ